MNNWEWKTPTFVIVIKTTGRSVDIRRNIEKEGAISEGIMYRVDDIPKYDNLFIRDGERVFVVNKYTGEILQSLSVLDYCDFWSNEYRTNEVVRKYYEKGLFFPKPTPDTATNIKELKSLCSDSSRTGRGDNGYLLDFMLLDSCTITESKMLKLVCDNVVVWNYSVMPWSQIKKGMNTGDKQTRRVYLSLLSKGLIIELTTKFEDEDGWSHLIKVHPKLFWKGRYSAFMAAVADSYEYGPDLFA